MTNEEFSKLKQGDVVRHEPSGSGYIVLSNRAGVPTVIRSIELHTGLDWSHVYTPTPVVAAPPVMSLVEKITELEKLGWTFNDRWISPNGFFHTESLHSAWTFRNDYNRVRSFTSYAEARLALRDAGWKNPYGKVWQSPAGNYFDGARAAYSAMIQGDGTCNAS